MQNLRIAKIAKTRPQALQTFLHYGNVGSKARGIRVSAPLIGKKNVFERQRSNGQH
jgi:hypothetical protein